MVFSPEDPHVSALKIDQFRAVVQLAKTPLSKFSNFIVLQIDPEPVVLRSVQHAVSSGKLLRGNTQVNVPGGAKSTLGIESADGPALYQNGLDSSGAQRRAYLAYLTLEFGGMDGV